VLRPLREESVKLGESTFYRVCRLEKEKLPSELMVRFEGVAGEFAQFDFGVADVRLLDGCTKRIHFAAYRLKHSRWVWVVVVPDEWVESLVRALLACFEASGTVPLRVVFDNPKTVVLGRDENGRPRWNLPPRRGQLPGRTAGPPWRSVFTRRFVPASGNGFGPRR
jgi:transposase